MYVFSLGPIFAAVAETRDIGGIDNLHCQYVSCLSKATAWQLPDKWKNRAQ